jgi:hypothetical protein
MISALTKSVTEVNEQDIQELIRAAWPETENVEYKAELSRKGDGPDPWYNGGNLSDQARNKLFKELVAFANTSGGRLFIGIGETRERPPRANTIQPVPRCHELAERLEQSLASSIDPPLTFFRVVGVGTHADGSGVVIADISASYNGPHRSPDLQCYVRKGTNSIPAGMREIHDMVMRFSRRQDEISRLLAERQKALHDWLQHGSNYGNIWVGFRATAIPIGAPLYVDSIFRSPLVSRDLHNVAARWVIDSSNIRPDYFTCMLTDLSERPVLGGTMWFLDGQDKRAQQLILRDGLIESRFKTNWQERPAGGGQRPLLYLGWIIAGVANVLARVNSFRKRPRPPVASTVCPLSYFPLTVSRTEMFSF